MGTPTPTATVTDGGAVTKETEDGERDFPLFLAVARPS